MHYPCRLPVLVHVAIIYLIISLANIAMVDKGLSEFLGHQGACETVVSTMEEHPTDLQVQAAGCTAIRALAASDTNIEILEAHRGPAAIARAQGIFSRDREVQLGCLGAMEAFCCGMCRVNREVPTSIVNIPLLEHTLQTFSDDAEVIAHALGALVELARVHSRSPQTPTKLDEWIAPEEEQRSAEGSEEKEHEDGNLKRQTCFSRSVVEGKTTTHHCTSSGQAMISASRAIGMVLAMLESNPCQEVCLAAFDALGHLLVIDDATTNEPGVESGEGADVVDYPYPVGQGRSEDIAAKSEDVGGMGRNMLQWAKVAYSVRRALKLNHQNDGELRAKGRRILTFLASARGRELAQ